MTNLTDEGLRQEAQWICDCKKQFKECLVCQKIASAFKQVRDAAKKEERELTCKLIMGLPLKRKHPLDYSSDYTREELCTAIRQMDRGN